MDQIPRWKILSEGGRGNGDTMMKMALTESRSSSSWTQGIRDPRRLDMRAGQERARKTGRGDTDIRSLEEILIEKRTGIGIDTGLGIMINY